MTTKSSKSIIAVWMFYLLIVFEIIYMISPFGVYYYSVYGPGLNLFHQNALVAWLSSFFLPHIVETSSFVLNNLKDIGWLLIAIGLGSFCIGAGQIYYYKFTKRGEVTFGIYKVIRHPQYTALIVAGFGMLLVWPRFLVLIMYITMLFVYYFLARHEEKECEEKYGDGYLTYKANTPMFFPVKLPAALKISILPKAGWQRSVTITAVYATVMTLSITTGFQLRNYGLSTISAVYFDKVALVSFPSMTPENIKRIWQISQTNPEVKRVFREDARYLSYVLPSEWYSSDVPMNIPDGLHGHHEPHNYAKDQFKMVITQANFAGEKLMAQKDIIKYACSRTGMLEVYIDTTKDEVTAVRKPPGNVRWGNIPTPLF